MLLRVQRLGPLEDSEVRVDGRLVVLLGEPASGKSYVLRALYTRLGVLDPGARLLCRPPRPGVEVLEAGVEGLSRLLAAVVFSAVDARASPAAWAERLGLRVSSYTVRGRESLSGDARRIWVELRLRRDSVVPLASYPHGGLVESYAARVRRCLEEVLLPDGSRFTVEPLERLGGDPRSLGVARVRLAEFSAAAVGCRVSGQVEAELVFEEGAAVARSVEAVVEAAGCGAVEPEQLASAVAEALPRDELGRAVARGLAVRVRAAAARAVGAVSGYGDAAYVAFTRSASLLLRSLAARLASPAAVNAIRSLLRHPETAVMGLAYARIGLGLRRRHGGGVEEPLRLLAGGRVEPGVGGLLFLDERRGVRLPLHKASALASEAASLTLIARGLREKPLLLLEEPEAQLHPRLQVALAALLPAVAEAARGTIVVSTHSDLLASTLAALASRSGEGVERLAERMRRLLEAALGVDAPDVAENAAKAVAAGVRFYLFTGSRVEPLEPRRLQMEAPSHGEAYEAILRAAL